MIPPVAPEMGPPGAPQGVAGAPPQAAPVAPPPPDPAQQAYQQAMGDWQQAQAAAQAVQAENQQKQQQFDDAVALLKKDAAHDFRIDIEADSTIVPDQQAEQQSRVEFMQAIIPLMEQIIPMAQGNPAIAELAKEISLFAVRGFRVARTIEETFEKAFDTIAKQPPQPQPGGKGQGDDVADAQADMARVQIAGKTADAKAQAMQQANAIKQAQVQGELMIKAQEAANEARYHQGRLIMDQAKLDSQKQFRQQEMLSMAEKAAEGLQ